MSRYLCVSIRFADPEPAFRGRGDAGEPEWPPSPLRAFQALVAAAAARFGNPAQFLDYGREAFVWFGSLGAPVVYAPPGERGTPFRTAVPNNDMDIVASAWSKRVEPPRQPSQLKALKTVQPTHLRGKDDELALHYVWTVPDDQASAFARHREFLFATARSVVALGWGVDMAFGCGRELDEAGVAALKGERWSPEPTGGSVRLRVSTAGTFPALVERHGEFLQQLHRGGYSPVPPLTAFDVVGYRRDTDSAPRPVVAFELHKTIAELDALPSGASKYRPFDPVRTPDFARKNGGDHHPCGAVVVAGLVRHAAAAACREQQWPEERVTSFVLGHGDQKEGQATTDDRLQFLPLPSITPLKVESIRRVLIAGPPGGNLDTFRHLLNGRELFAEGHSEPVAMLSIASRADGPVREYLRASCVWSTVTPVVLPGFDDPSGVRKRLSTRTAADAFPSGELKNDAVARLDAEVRKLLLRAFAHAGVPSGLLSAELLASGAAGLEWREVGFRAGVGRSREYRLGSQPGYPRYHVRVRFAQAVSGPLCVGNGRYRGLGLFAAE